MSLLSRAAKGKMYMDRVDWANNLLNEIQPKGPIVGVEVGLWKADFPFLLLPVCDRLSWIAVDPYFEYGRKARKQEGWDQIYARVIGKMNKFGERFISVRKSSSEGVDLVPEGVDFCFIDGNHDYPYVLEDLILYEPKVRPGGIMAGHDYILGGVKKAVNEYAVNFNREIIHESFDPFGVWWWRMP